MHAGLVRGGTALNTVPDRAEISFEIRYLATEEPVKLLAELAAIGPKDIEIEAINHYPGLDTNENDPVWKSFQTITTVSGPIKVAFGTEAGFFANIGLRTAVIGPGSMACDGHKPNEGIDVNQLRSCYNFCAKLQHNLHVALRL